jgi:integrase
LDLANGKVYVRRSVYKGQQVTVKTKKSFRLIHIESTLVDMLQKHLNGQKSGLVFQTRLGTPFSKDNVRRKLHSILDELGLKRGGLHAFRHGRVSFLRKRGVAEKIVRDWIGHSTLRMADHYTHFEDDDRKQIAANLGGLNGVIAPNPPKSPQVAVENQVA